MNLGFTEMAFIFVLALIIFGPKKLPEIGRQVGKALAEFKRASNEFKWQLEAEMRQIEAEATKERLNAAAPKSTPQGLTERAQPETSGNSIKPPEMEIYPTTFGVEFRPTQPSQALSSELVDPETVKPEERKSPDA
jgi:sec-independent protein translocase protein TatB